jgi:putative transposase
VSIRRTNAYAGRCVRTVRRERLDRILTYNPRHLLATLDEYVRHYNEHRPHQSREQLSPAQVVFLAQVADLATLRVRRRRVVNGLINEYSQAA